MEVLFQTINNPVFYCSRIHARDTVLFKIFHRDPIRCLLTSIYVCHCKMPFQPVFKCKAVTPFKKGWLQSIIHPSRPVRWLGHTQILLFLCTSVTVVKSHTFSVIQKDATIARCYRSWVAILCYHRHITCILHMPL